MRILAKHRVEEGIKACVDYIGTQNKWASENRTPELIEILLSYGARAKSSIPQLRELVRQFEAGEENFPKNLSLQKAGNVREAIRAIEESNEIPELIRIK